MSPTIYQKVNTLCLSVFLSHTHARARTHTHTHTYIYIYNAPALQTYQISARYTKLYHYNDVIVGAMASPITSLTFVYSTVYSGADQSKHQSSASLAFVWGIHQGPMNSPHKWPVTRKMFPFDDVIILSRGPIHWGTIRFKHKIILYFWDDSCCNIKHFTQRDSIWKRLARSYYEIFCGQTHLNN